MGPLREVSRRVTWPWARGPGVEAGRPPGPQGSGCGAQIPGSLRIPLPRPQSLLAWPLAVPAAAPPDPGGEEQPQPRVGALQGVPELPVQLRGDPASEGRRAGAGRGQEWGRPRWPGQGEPGVGWTPGLGSGQSSQSLQTTLGPLGAGVLGKPGWGRLGGWPAGGVAPGPPEGLAG